MEALRISSIRRSARGPRQFPKSTPERPRFRHGDVLITIGLDWEYPGLHDTIRTLKRQHGLIVVSCCYDLIPILYPQYCVGDVASWFKNYLIDMTWVSDGILCISENTRRDFQDFALSVGLPPSRTEVIKLGSSVPSPNPADKLSTQVSEILDLRYFSICFDHRAAEES